MRRGVVIAGYTPFIIGLFLSVYRPGCSVPLRYGCISKARVNEHYSMDSRRHEYRIS